MHMRPDTRGVVLAYTFQCEHMLRGIAHLLWAGNLTGPLYVLIMMAIEMVFSIGSFHNDSNQQLNATHFPKSEQILISLFIGPR